MPFDHRIGLAADHELLARQGLILARICTAKSPSCSTPCIFNGSRIRGQELLANPEVRAAYLEGG
jgi:hypothetical protein